MTECAGGPRGLRASVLEAIVEVLAQYREDPEIWPVIERVGLAIEAADQRGDDFDIYCALAPEELQRLEAQVLAAYRRGVPENTLAAAFAAAALVSAIAAWFIACFLAGRDVRTEPCQIEVDVALS